MRLSVPLVLLALAASGCGGSAPLYASAPLTPEVVVDGAAREWTPPLRPVPQEAGLSLGLRNTDDALVVALIARDDRQARRIALGGVQLWLDPEGGTDRAVGVRFPAPPPPARVDIRRAEGEAGPQILRRRFERTAGRVEVTRQDSVRVVEPGDVPGLETAAQWGPDALVVEVRLPLGAGALLPSTPEGTLGLGVQLLDLPNRRRGPVPDFDPNEAFDPPTVTRWLVVDLAE